MEALFQIEAISKSNAQLTRLKIPVPQYIIGHSFDTVFSIKNLTMQKSPRLTFEIEVKMDDYSYTFERQLDSIPAGASYTTNPINWKVLNQGVCTFSFINLIIAGDTELLKSAKHDFIDNDGKPVKPSSIFHSVVTTTPEGVYEYWAMIISAIGLAVIALEKIIPFLINIINWGYKLLTTIK